MRRPGRDVFEVLGYRADDRVDFPLQMTRSDSMRVVLNGRFHI